MNLLRLLLSLLLVLGTAACSRAPRERAERQLRKSGAEALRHDAALLYKNYYSAHTIELISLRANSWPDSFRPFTPLRVGIYRDGVALALTGSSGGEAGLYIVPRSMELSPKPSPGAVFERLAEGIYWYSFSH